MENFFNFIKGSLWDFICSAYMPLCIAVIGMISFYFVFVKESKAEKEYRKAMRRKNIEELESNQN